MAQLILFYDGTCPLCVNEMLQLQQADTLGCIQLEDISSPDFVARFPQIDPVEANLLLHAMTPDNRILLGLDATCAAWGLTGKQPWLRLLRLPLIKPVADLGYRLFARYRYQISWVLTGQRRGECGSAACQLRRGK
ncbi:DUF393 domain-containing protein [Shewanella corallii]|uniref:DUF393 domain-containing protein n=1 Tax=Shewanella corallii TaxID=560080 RepID=A0ABT0N640_9GAMM|nr:DUF393 domain-containing protein [Shewanella corallii]MCL2913600.1 DUF393 domain-containing protein [Shewanella corallii]